MKTVGVIGRHITGEQDRNDERVHGDDTGHDHWDERLPETSVSAVCPHHSFHAIPSAKIGAGHPKCFHVYLRHTFIIRSGLNVPTPAMPIPDFAVP